ncbi:MAG: hypothetical protein U5N85_16655 [Arcicella sp.]|nr:hypothetical protein [Arcicella sp.]
MIFVSDTFGELMSSALGALPNAFYFTDKFSLHNWLIDKALQNSFVLIKGSRGVSLETTLRFCLEFILRYFAK